MDSEAINVRMERDMIDRLDDFRRAEKDMPSRPEAIRRLVEKGLDRNQP